MPHFFLRHQPRHPLTAYNLFFQLQRQRIVDHDADRAITALDVAKLEIRKTNEKKKKAKRKATPSTTATTTTGEQGASGAPGKLGFAELARTIAAKWKQLDADSKAIFERRASADKIRYKLELEQWGRKAIGKTVDVKVAAEELRAISGSSTRLNAACETTTTSLFGASVPTEEDEEEASISMEWAGVESFTQQHSLHAGAARSSDISGISAPRLMAFNKPPAAQIMCHGRSSSSSSSSARVGGGGSISEHRQQEIYQMLVHFTGEVRRLSLQLQQEFDQPDVPAEGGAAGPRVLSRSSSENTQECGSMVSSQQQQQQRRISAPPHRAASLGGGTFGAPNFSGPFPQHQGINYNNNIHHGMSAASAHNIMAHQNTFAVAAAAAAAPHASAVGCHHHHLHQPDAPFQRTSPGQPALISPLQDRKTDLYIQHDDDHLKVVSLNHEDIYRSEEVTEPPLDTTTAAAGAGENRGVALDPRFGMASPYYQSYLYEEL